MRKLDLGDQPARLLRDCRDLLAPEGRLIAVIGPGHHEPAALIRAVLSTAARTRLRPVHRHIAVPGPTIQTASSRTAASPSTPSAHIDLLVLTRGDRDD